uniref:TPX2 central domain-containing protein n=1 Tax=Oryza meridionalis TaxID=40149 RepID=A0A0E0DMK0_9ORYZ
MRQLHYQEDLMLTKPKEVEFQTSHRVRAVRVKSYAELEEEMLANIPKFRAQPFNKKIAEAPSFPPLPRKAQQFPEFSEFHIKMMVRATRHADTCSEASSVGTVRIAEALHFLLFQGKLHSFLNSVFLPFHLVDKDGGYLSLTIDIIDCKIISMVG